VSLGLTDHYLLCFWLVVTSAQVHIQLPYEESLQLLYTLMMC
jgi:hypothetical protein